MVSQAAGEARRSALYAGRFAVGDSNPLRSAHRCAVGVFGAERAQGKRRFRQRRALRTNGRDRAVQVTVGRISGCDSSLRSVRSAAEDVVQRFFGLLSECGERDGIGH